MRNKKFLLASVFSIIFLIAALLFNFFGSERAAAVSPLLPFGGPILQVIPCGCSNGHVVVVGPPGSPAKTEGLLNRFHFVPTQTILFRFFQTARIGAWLLGTYMPGTGNQCLLPVEDGCIIVPNDGVIKLLGTSL